MRFQSLTTKQASALTPQVVTVVVDDSGSMQGDKAKLASVGMRDLVITMQSGNLGSKGFRYLVSLAKFGTLPIALARAATPEEVALTQLQFDGSSGGTEMVGALVWAQQALCAALEKCRLIQGYREDHAPTPLVVFISDGANTGPDIAEAAQTLKSVKFAGGAIDVVAAGIGMEEKDFEVMRRIASRPELAANLPPSELSAFLAAVGATVVAGKNPEHIMTAH